VTFVTLYRGDEDRKRVVDGAWDHDGDEHTREERTMTSPVTDCFCFFCERPDRPNDTDRDWHTLALAKSQAPVLAENLLTAAHAAKRLGIAPVTLCERAQAGDIKSVRIGRADDITNYTRGVS
jgi:hypothetical protein